MAGAMRSRPGAFLDQPGAQSQKRPHLRPQRLPLPGQILGAMMRTCMQIARFGQHPRPGGRFGGLICAKPASNAARAA